MIALYLESSAALTWLLGEPKASQVIAKVNEADLVVTSVLTVVETRRALTRSEKQGLLTAAECQILMGMLARASSGRLMMEVTEEVRERAVRSFPSEPVRTLSALHLASALLFLRVYPDMRLLSYDPRIACNAQALGIG